MRNLEGMPTEEENEGINPENNFSENFDLPEESTVGIGEKKEQQEVLMEEFGFRESMEAVAEQQKEIKEEIKDRDDRGILSRLSQKGYKFAGAAVLSLASFAAGCSRSAEASKNFESQKSADVKNISAGSQERDETIIERRRVVKSDRPAERGDPKKDLGDNDKNYGKEDRRVEEEKAEEKNKGFFPETNAPIIRGPEADLDDVDEKAHSQKEASSGRIEEKRTEENNEGFVLGKNDFAQEAERILAEEYRQAHDKERPVISRQAERRILENFRYFIKNSNVVSLKDGSFAVDIGINGGNDDRVVAGTIERPCYKVEPEDLAELERIRREHFKKVNFALSKRPFIPTEVKEGIRKKTERSLKRAIMYCKEITEDKLPEEIKKAREREKEEIKNKKEKIIAKNKDNKIRREISEIMKRSERPESEKSIRETPDPSERLEKRIKSIREIRSRGK